MYYGFVYEWTNNINGKKYIGSHVGTIEDGYVGSGKAFRRAIKKHGIENFTRTIIEYVDVTDKQFLLEREKFYLDQTQAYYSRDYYNIAKDVSGGDTKAGWSDERKELFRQQIKQVWEKRTNDEKRAILDDVHQKAKEWYQTDNGIKLKEKLKGNVDRLVEGTRNRDPDDRKRSARLGKERMGSDRRKEAAQKGVKNRKPEREKIAREKAKETRNSWTAEKREEVFKNMSEGRKGKCSGSGNGRAKKIVAASKEFDTLKAAMLELKICEATLHKRLKDPNNREYYYI